MNFQFPKLELGTPIRHNAFTIVPINIETKSSATYVLAEDAIQDKSLHVEEVGNGGSVPALSVHNTGDSPVLILEGQELIGAKQNRIVNTSVLIPAKEEHQISVSCVEQGRWRYQRNRKFASGSQATAKLRGKLKRSVSESLKRKQGHLSNQREVWSEVSKLHKQHDIDSQTNSMSDAFLKHRLTRVRYRERLPYVDGASGLAMLNGKNILSIDIFDKPETCMSVWSRLVQSAVFDLQAVPDRTHNASEIVNELLAQAKSSPWTENPVAGLGKEYRADVSIEFAGSSLCLGDTPLHTSLANSEIQSPNANDQ